MFCAVPAAAHDNPQVLGALSTVRFPLLPRERSHLGIER